MKRILLLLCSSFALAQDIPLFTTDFPPEEFAARRGKVYEAIGSNAIAVLQGAEGPQGYTRFRQSNEFYYLCGVEVPHAYLVLNGAAKTTTLFLPHRNPGRERSEGKLLSAEDVDEVKKLTGIESVMGIDLLAEMLGRYERAGVIVDLYAPFAPAEGFAMSRDLAVRYANELAGDPFDGRISREQTFLKHLHDRFPSFTMKNLTPAVDELRSIKSPREIVLIKKATRLGGLALIEGMRSTKPGVYEYELDGMAKYIYYRNGAQGEAYYSLIASGPNALVGHYNAGKRVMKEGEWLLFDFAPDVGYYMSDVTRMIPVGGKFSASQRELYGFYISCYKAILNAIRPNATGKEIFTDAVKEMDAAYAKMKFSKDLYAKACSTFVDRFRRQSQNPKASLGHWTGMATHDVGMQGVEYKPGMVFTIEPSLVIPEENINIRLEDLIVITEKGRDVVSEFIPMEIEAIEKTMKEEGMLQRYPRDGGK
jgi:Xaa-Pro aminopeptidase